MLLEGGEDRIFQIVGDIPEAFLTDFEDGKKCMRDPMHRPVNTFYPQEREYHGIVLVLMLLLVSLTLSVKVPLSGFILFSCFFHISVFFLVARAATSSRRQNSGEPHNPGEPMLTTVLRPSSPRACATFVLNDVLSST